MNCVEKLLEPTIFFKRKVQSQNNSNLTEAHYLGE